MLDKITVDRLTGLR